VRGSDPLDMIMTRRSIRNFKPGNVLSDDLEKILQAGIMAPSPGNGQPWRFHIIRGKTKQEFVEVLRNAGALPQAVRRLFAQIMETVPVVIAVENPNISLGISPAPAYEKETREVDIRSLGSLLGTAACVENMLLAIHFLGYGSVWMGLPPILDAARQVIDVGGELMGVLPVGRPADRQIEYVNRSRRPLEEIARFYE